jgi:hypothetical protein
MALFSRVATLTIRPFRGYTLLAREWETEGANRRFVRVLTGAARLLGVVGIFVSFTSTGRLSPVDAVLAAGAFTWILGVQAAALFSAKTVTRAKVPFLTLAALYLEGHGIWLFALLAICGALLFAPDSLAAVAVVGPVAILVAFFWGIVTTVALFRSGVGMSRKRAFGATLTFYCVTTGLVLSYYLLLGQLLPILPFGRMPP